MKHWKSLCVLGSLGVLSILTGCNDKAKQERAAERHNFEIIYDYDYDEVRPIIEGEKTVADVYKSLTLAELGILKKDARYAKTGRLEENGVFVNAAITDGDGIPKLPNLSEADVKKINSLEDGLNDPTLITELKQLQEQREKVLKENQEKLKKEEEVNKDALTQEVKAQEKARQQSEAKKEEMIKEGIWKD